ncbi:MAG: methyltransferase [Candidatus Nanoarchaeia archaeon]
MKCLGICPEGFEEAAKLEVNEITGKPVEGHKACVSFETESYEEIARVCYSTQSLYKVLLMFNEFEYQDLEKELKEHIDKTEFGSWFDNRKFRANVFHFEDLDIGGMELAALAGEYVIDKTGAKADMENWDVIFLVFVHKGKCYFGIDFAGLNLSKRDYKIYNNPSSLNAVTAISLLKMAGWTPGKILLDPMCGSGVIPIEAALAYLKKPPHFHLKDKLAFTRFMDFDFSVVDETQAENTKTGGKEANIYCSDHVLAALRATKNNAKIADVDKVISATKCDLEWLETKFDERSIDFIITHPPAVSKHSNLKQLKKVYNELFYQAEYVLKDTGVVGILAESMEELQEAAEKNNFAMESSKNVWQGKHKFYLMLFKKA